MVFGFFFRTTFSALFSRDKMRHRALLSELYRRYIFDIKHGIRLATLEETIDGDITYRLYNSYPAADPTARVSCLGFEESIQLAALVQHVQPQNILEIGTNKGGTTYNLLLNSPETTTIHTIDLHDTEPENKSVKAAFASSRIRRITADSRKLSAGDFATKFDFIFVDAGHSLEDVKSDTKLAFDVLNPGGTIVWHDYCRLEPGVVSFLNGLSRTHDLVHLQDGTLVVLLAYFPGLAWSRTH
ncbi:MAG: class I SAM-dependent methyltransferase [Bdellovibrionales bacterium]